MGEIYTSTRNQRDFWSGTTRYEAGANSLRLSVHLEQKAESSLDTSTSIRIKLEDVPDVIEILQRALDWRKGNDDTSKED